MTKPSMSLVASVLLTSILVLVFVIFWNRDPQPTANSQPVIEIDTVGMDTVEINRVAERRAPLPQSATPPPLVTPGGTATPISDPGVRVENWRSLLPSNGKSIRPEFRKLSLDENVFATLEIVNGSTPAYAFIAIDIETGTVQRVAEFGSPLRFSAMHTSDRYVVWVESDPRVIGSSELHLYDLRNGNETVINPGSINHMHFRHGLAVWQGTRKEIGGIHGYDLAKQEIFTIEAHAETHYPLWPRACNSEWMIYLLDTSDKEEAPGTLHARNLVTGQDLVLGSVIIAQVMEPTIHDCDQEIVVWNNVPDAANQSWDEWQPELRLYNLATHEQRVFYQPMSFRNRLSINDDIVEITREYNSLLYDWRRDRFFEGRSVPDTTIKEVAADGKLVRLQQTEDAARSSP